VSIEPHDGACVKRGRECSLTDASSASVRKIADGCQEQKIPLDFFHGIADNGGGMWNQDTCDSGDEKKYAVFFAGNNIGFFVQ
jgi:hypothetical protein